MLGSHDSYTFMKAMNPIVNCFKRFWRTQDKSIKEQYDFGVRYFDIRLYRRKIYSGIYAWSPAHGAARFDKIYVSVSAVMQEFEEKYPGCMLRIWLESGSDDDWKLFCKEIDEAVAKYNNISTVYRKKDYELHYSNPNEPSLAYYPLKMERSVIVKNFFKRPIYNWSKEHNPVITKEMIEDKNVCYFIDYVTNCEKQID